MSEEPKKTKNNGFFTLDVKRFASIQKLGLGVEEAASYLALMVSTDETNVTSAGGIKSISTYTGLTSTEARKAVGTLQKKGLVEALPVERARARKVARFSLPVHDQRSPLSDMEKAVVTALAAGIQPERSQDVSAAHRAKQKGYLERLADVWHVIEHKSTVAYIPNRFVRQEDGNSPLSRLVAVGELAPIMLAAELYEIQDLFGERGVPVSALRAYYSADTAPTGLRQHRVHYLENERKWTERGKDSTFMASHHRIWRTDGDVWAALRVLDACHVTEWAVYSANGKPTGQYDTKRPVRPLGVLRNGRQVLSTPEAHASFMAFLVAHLVETNGRLGDNPRVLVEEWQNRTTLVAVENAAVPHVEGVGILRMVWRADTDNTRAWLRDLHTECDRAVFFLESVLREHFGQVYDRIEEAFGAKNGYSVISK